MNFFGLAFVHSSSSAAVVGGVGNPLRNVFDQRSGRIVGHDDALLLGQRLHLECLRQKDALQIGQVGLVG